MLDVKVGARPLPPYSLFADFYTVHIAPYLKDAWEASFRSMVLHRLRSTRACADVACGPGLAAVCLAETFDLVFAVDVSLPMLLQAGRMLRGAKVMLLRQDMRFLRLPCRVDLINCWGDSLNHLIREEDFLWALRSFAVNLERGGLLYFDLNTENQLREGAGEEWYEMEMPSGRARWRLSWEGEGKTSLLEVVFYDAGNREIGREVIRERVYPREMVLALLSRAGFSPLEWVDAATLRPPAGDARRVAVLAERL